MRWPKLTETQKWGIWFYHRDNPDAPYRIIAKEFGTSIATVSNVLTRFHKELTPRTNATPLRIYIRKPDGTLIEAR